MPKMFLAILSVAIFCVTTTFAQTNINLKAGRARIVLDKTGRLFSLTSTEGKDVLDASRPSFLLMLQPYGEGAKSLKPHSLRTAKVSEGKTRLTFSYDKGFTVTVEATEKKQYLRLELIEANPIAEIARITWGPVNTTMKDPLGGYLGLIRERDFTVGMMSLEPNTDGNDQTGGGYYQMASFNNADGSRLQAESWDHTRSRSGQEYYRPIPVTVQGSAIALFGCTRTEELDRVEAVVLGEKLPHPTIDGVWSKRSDHHIAPQLWIQYTQANMDDYLKLAKVFGASTIGNFHDLFGNWGHFALNPKLYPGEMRDLRNIVDKCAAAGVGHIMYTYSTFLRNRNEVDEPFITPKFNADMQHTGPIGKLTEALNETAVRLVLKSEPGLLAALNNVNYIRIGSELIARNKAEEIGGTIVVQGVRGAMGTYKTTHPVGTKLFCINQHFLQSFCPGTIELQDSVTDNMAKVAREGGFPQVTIDGYESCLVTGHGAYAKNRFSSRLFEKIGNPELRMTPSNFGNYDWHLMSYISWGELNREKGFRGTMLDYRLRRAIELKNSRMPTKLGQFYPDDAKSPEDFQWLMGLATGWGAGLDFHFDHANPNDPKIRSFGEIVRLWTEARKAGFFSEKQLMNLRETDRLYQLTSNTKGRYHLEFVRRWTHPGLEILPPAVFKITSQHNAMVENCSIDWSWTHNPGIYVKAGVSDDLVTPANGKESVWDITYPTDDRLYFVIRVPEDAPGAVRNPTVVINGTRLVVPVTLQPGQYISTPHDGARVGIYNRNHEIIGESYIRCVAYRLPAVKGNEPQHISLSAEAVDPKKTPVIRMNLRTRVAIPSEEGEL